MNRKLLYKNDKNEILYNVVREKTAVIMKNMSYTKRSFLEPGLMSAGSVILHELARTGSSTFRQITHSKLARSAGAHLNENSYYTALARLKKRKMIDKGGYGYALTPRGEWSAIKASVQYGIAGQRITTSTWDGKWRIVLFDFPESKRMYRDYVRCVLKKLGFREFQRSAWIFPYKLPNYLLRLFSESHLLNHVRVITSKDINYDKDLRKKFKLV